MGKGDPLEGQSKNVIQAPSGPPQGDGALVGTSSSSRSPEEIIYEAYPRKVARPSALRAIRRALANCSFEFLRERTELFARTYDGPIHYIPYPSTWFNQERYKDDPANWRRGAAAKANVDRKAQPSRQFDRDDYHKSTSTF
jgi:hypothetical protein